MAQRLLSFENGVLSAATAFGKTVVCSYLIAERKVSPPLRFSYIGTGHAEGEGPICLRGIGNSQKQYSPVLWYNP